MKKCAVIYNSHSGRKKYSLEKLEIDFNQILTEYGYTTAFYKSKYKGAVTDIVRSLDDDFDLVISMGGDGTFSEAMKGIFDRKKKLVLAHIPTGTTNDIGKMYGYGKNMKDNLNLLLSGEEKEVDICTINGTPFVYVAGFGRFLNIPYDTSRKKKKIFGYLAYLGQGAKEIIRKVKMYDLSYEVNGEKKEGQFSVALITNSTRVAGLNNIFNDIKLDDGLFEVLLCDLKKKKQFAKSILLLASNDISNVPGVYYYKTDKIIFHFDSYKNVWDIDGEKIKTKGKDVEIKIEKARIMVPSANISTLFVK